MSKKLTKNSTLKEVLSQEGAEEILARHNVPCLFCPFRAQEMTQLKIGDICRMYGIDAEKLLKDLNEFLKNKNK